MTLDLTDAARTARATTDPGAPVAPDRTTAAHVSGRLAAGLGSLAAAVACLSMWLGWWALALDPGPLPIALLVLEVIGLLAGVGVALALVRSRRPLDPDSDAGAESATGPDADRTFRYLDAVIAGHGVHQAHAVRRQLEVAVRTATRMRPTRSRDVARGGVIVEGPRRLVQLVLVTLALLVGAAPFPVPPVWALGMLTIGLAAMSLSHSLLSGGTIVPGDRIRWSYASMGEMCSRRSDDGTVAPRRWVGVVGAAVALCLAIALRGISDRWTHGLPAMPLGERVALMSVAIVLVVGALATLCTIPEPTIRDEHLLARRLEERTARQSVLAGAVCVGVIGFLAGVLPGHVDATDRDVTGIEQITDRDATGVDGLHALR